MDKEFKIKCLIYFEKKKIFDEMFLKKLKFELKNDEKIIDFTFYKIELIEDFFFLKFSLKFDNELRNRILATLYLKINDEVIGTTEIVIVRNKEDAEKEIKECEKNIIHYQNILKDKNLNILSKNINENLSYQERRKKDEYYSYYMDNFYK
jgi:hypothetical protein